MADNGNGGREGRYYSPKSEEALEYFNACTTIEVRYADGRRVEVPLNKLDEQLRRMRAERRQERGARQ